MVMELYFVTVETNSGKRDLHPVWIDSPTGIDLQRRKDIESALNKARDDGYTPTGDVFPANSISKANAVLKDHENSPYDHVKKLYERYSTQEGLDEYLKSEVAGDEKEQLAEDFERITLALSDYMDNVLPVNTKVRLAQALGTSTPTLYRVMSSCKVDARRGVSWLLIAKLLKDMGLLEEVKELVEQRVASLQDSKSQYLQNENIVEKISTGRPGKAQLRSVGS